METSKRHTLSQELDVGAAQEDKAKTNFALLFFNKNIK